MFEGLWNHFTVFDRLTDRFERSHPTICMVVFQAIVGLFLIAAVSGIALLGGSVIWIFYKILEVL